MRYHSNKTLEFERDELKSYVYVKDKGKDIGMFAWDYTTKRWRYNSVRQTKKHKKIVRKK